MNLRLCLMTAWDAGEKRHAQTIMRDLGITYAHSTPQSICDQWWFWNCEGVPDVLPPYLSELKLSPQEAVGNGLSQEVADRLDGKPPKSPILLSYRFAAPQGVREHE